MSKSPAWHIYPRTRNANKPPQERTEKVEPFYLDVVSRATLRTLQEMARQDTGLTMYGPGPVITTLLKTHPLSRAIYKRKAAALAHKPDGRSTNDGTTSSSSQGSSSS